MNKSEGYFVFTDGSSRGNPGPGGWGTVIVCDGVSVTELGGANKHTTNNAMELTAAVEALRNIPEDSSVVLNTDSSYVINGITKWVKGWKRGGWLTKTKSEVLNRDLWEELHDLNEVRTVKWTYVGGHVGVVGNERCDHIATNMADGNTIKLYKGPLGGYDLPKILEVSHDAVKAGAKKSDSSRSKAKAYSYVSMVGGVIETHKTWPECEKRVKGTKGAKYKKSLSSSDEQDVISEFATFTF